MRARTFGLLALIVAGVAPLSAYALLSVERSERTAVAEVAAANARLARSIAGRIAAYGDNQRELLHTIGVAALRADRPQWVLDDYAIQYRHFKELAVYGADGARRAGPELPPAQRGLVERALAGEPARSEVIPAERGGRVFGHTQYTALPVVLVGEQIGAVVARIDLIDTWTPVKAVRVGERGFARLLSFDGTLLAHGDPEESRSVFAGERAKDARILAGALLGVTVPNHQGFEVIASAAAVPGEDWVVIVERPVAEAHAAAAMMRRDLIWFGAAALALVVAAGVLFGRRLVRGLERLRDHTRTLAGGALDARIEVDVPVVEIEVLAGSLNEMAASIQTLTEQARARERLSTFARVAAGLAHDLRHPIEAVRAACAEIAADPSDPAARRLFAFMRDQELPRLKRYVDDLQRAAHEEAIQVDRREVRPRALVDQVVEEVASRPKWRDIELAASGDAPDVSADPELLRRALYNLVANAADACIGRDPAEVRIDVGDSPDGRFVELRVRDTGAGIEPTALARLLDGDFHSTKRSSGIGLGFGVARHVARAHGGEIVGESTVGTGSTFTVRIPRVARKPETPDPADDRVAADATH